jgi:FMN-dependent NADH-azoreductase
MAPDTRTAEETQAVEGAMELVDELRAADVIVIGSGMMNFGPSSQLKAWIDNVTWPGVTFSYGAGVPQGLLTGKKVYLVTAAGGFSRRASMHRSISRPTIFCICSASSG